MSDMYHIQKKTTPTLLSKTRSQKQTECAKITYFLCILLYTSHPTRTPTAKMSITTVIEIPTVTPEELEGKKRESALNKQIKLAQ